MEKVTFDRASAARKFNCQVWLCRQGIRDWLVHVARSVHTSQFVPVCSVMAEVSRTTGAVDSDVEFDEDMSQSDGKAEAGPVLPDSSNHTQRAKLFATVVGAITSHEWSTSCHRVRQRLFLRQSHCVGAFTSWLETSSHQLASYS